jgi:hypothetical protein
VISIDRIPDSLTYSVINFLIANKNANPDLHSKYLIDKQMIPFIFYFKDDSIALTKLDTLFTRKDIDFIFSQEKQFSSFKINPTRIRGKIILNADSIDRYNHRPLSSISFPLFNLDKSIFIVRTFYSCGMLCGKGGIYMYKKEKSKWVLIETISSWIS